MFIHVVLFWLKPGTPDLVKEEMSQFARDVMPKISAVKNVWSGKSVPSPRDVVDSSYQVGLCVVFADKAGHDIYQDHELHLEFIKRFKQHWERVRVFDFQ